MSRLPLHLPGAAVATHLVNLDALIPREDFEAQRDAASGTAQLSTSLKLSELEAQSLVYTILRKPDFQRETASWTPEKVADLVKNFVDGELIPAIIMWRSPFTGNIFVIDGAHRLSALMAYVHDDYGDNSISIPFFGNLIPPEQQKAAKTTRDLIGQTVGKYALLKFLAQTPDKAVSDSQRLRARNAAIFSIQLQWVTGDATKAEASFFTINQQATPIDQTELGIIKARRKPNAVAARALIRAGTGHKYWSAFSSTAQAEIEKLAKDVYDILFDPALETPIKTLDLPIAGRGYSAESVKLLFEFINFANGLKQDMWLEEPLSKRKKKNNQQAVVPDDVDGATTIKYLKVVGRIASRISGNLPRSLGLHPAVYFYGATGRYQPTAFLATVDFIQELERTNTFSEFTKIRAKFEDFLVKYRHFINQIAREKGSGLRGLQSVKTLYALVRAGVTSGHSDDQIIATLKADTQTRFLKEQSEEDVNFGKNFTTETKSAAFLRDAIDGAVRCSICNARVHKKGISVDHKQRKQDGGSGELDNAQITHPYCNSGYKESQHSQQVATDDGIDWGDSPD